MKLKPKNHACEPTEGKLLKLFEKQIGPVEHRAIDALSKYEGNPRKLSVVRTFGTSCSLD